MKELWNFKLTERESKWIERIRGNGYRLDKRVFMLWGFVVIVLLLVAWQSIGWTTKSQVYVKCPADAYAGYCENPIYGKAFCNDPVCNMMRLPAGFEYGRKPSNFFLNLPFISFGLLFIAFFINHLIHNRGFMLEVEP